MARSFTYGAVTKHTAILSRFGAQAGFFAREGIDLTVRTVFGGPEMSAAVESGEVNVGEVGTPPGLTAIGAGRRIRIVGSALDRGLAIGDALRLAEPGTNRRAVRRVACHDLRLVRSIFELIIIIIQLLLIHIEIDRRRLLDFRR